MSEDRQDNQTLEAKENLQKGLRILAKIIAREILAGRFPDCPVDIINGQPQKGGEKDE
jgi:hypothetical protein